MVCVGIVVAVGEVVAVATGVEVEVGAGVEVGVVKMFEPPQPLANNIRGSRAMVQEPHVDFSIVFQFWRFNAVTS